MSDLNEFSDLQGSINFSKRKIPDEEQDSNRRNSD